MLRRAFACVVALCPACSFDFDAAGPRGGGATDGGGPAGAGNPSGGNGEGAGSNGGEAMGGDGVGGDGSGGTPVNDCSDGGGECMPLATGFDGAVLLNAGCGAAAKVFEGHESFTFQDATCGCTCGPEAALCTLPAQASSFPNAECMADKLIGIFTPSEVCDSVPGGQMTHSVQLDGAPIPPDCVSDMGPADIPDIVFSGPLQGCSFESIGCGGDLCVPTGERYCVYRLNAGPTLECPAGLSDTPLIQAADIDDSRGCTCPCGAKISDGCTTPLWQLHSGSGCGNLLVATSATCAAAPNGVIGSASVSAASAVQCTQVQDPFGTVQAMPSLQLCCSPP